VPRRREGEQLPAARASEPAEAGEAATSGGDETATPLAAPPRRPTQGGYNGGFCIPSCGKVEKKKKEKKKKKKNTTPAERGAAKTKTAHADPPLDLKRIHHLLGTLYNVTKSANHHEIRIEEHDDYLDFEEAACELSCYLLDEEVLPTVWAKLGIAKLCGTVMEQARHILCWEFGVTAPQYVPNAIVNTCCSGFPTGHADLRIALQTQDTLCATLSRLQQPGEDELEGEEPEEDEEDELEGGELEEEVETMNRGGAPATIYHLWQPAPSWT